MTSRAASRLAWSCATLALALLVTGVVIALPEGDSSVGDLLLYDGSWLVVLVTSAAVGALIASRQPRNPIGWILCALAVEGGLASVAEGYADRYLAGDGGSRGLAETAAWLANWSWIPLVLVPAAFVPLYFPHGLLPSARWRIVAWAAGVGIAGLLLSEAFAAGRLDDYEQIANPYGIDHVVVGLGSLGGLLVLFAVVASAASVVVRFRRSSGAERQQIKWLAYAGCFVAAVFVASVFIGGLWSEDVANALVLAGLLGLPLAIGIAILRHGLYDIDLLINRTLVYGGLTAGVVAIYVALVGGLSAVFHERAGFWLSLLATGLAALLVQPLRSQLQRRVNRLMYGGESGPHSAASGLRGRLHEAFVPEAAEVQRARERLVATREEERRRLHRDLHDGLGPTLAGAALRVEAAEDLIGEDRAAAGLHLEHARAEIQEAVADIRRLVYGLRPPALDELGLVAALREQADRVNDGADGSLGPPRMQVDVDAPEDLDGLPAAVEVAAYRIALEAITNAARHAGASLCVVRISFDAGLALEISDDGQGLPSDYRPGVGITSMRERAEELGGSCEIETAADRGTLVRARLPLAST